MAQAINADSPAYNSDKNYILRIASERNNILRIEPFFKGIEECKKLDDAKFYNIMIATTEAVNNAIIHGNCSNPLKIVEISVCFSSEGVIISVTDEGSGFSCDDIADPTAPENLMREGGRGVFLMRALAKKIDFFASPIRSGVVMHF